MSWISAILVITGLSLVVGTLLSIAVHRCQTNADPLIESINALLPQTQCGQCGYPGCRPYATAIAQGEAINKCVPGGQVVIQQLADQLRIEVPVVPLADPQTPTTPPRRLAWIDEAYCIGCTKCLQACPVDAIIGSAKQLHTVLTDYCTGCDLCVAPCPTSCIEMLTPEQLIARWPLPPQVNHDQPPSAEHQ
ncbi:MAG: electron transport complex subunit RsxB [Candidatus Symbiodolus clandestinus]